MPYRKTPLINGEIYHVFNRSIAQEKIFGDQRLCQRFLDIINFYRFKQTPCRFSYFLRHNPDKQQEILRNLYQKNDVSTKILSFSLMPNHFHLLLQQIQTDGIQLYLKLIQESFAKYINLLLPRTGSAFQQAFKVVHIENEPQFIHTARYIHLNPVTSNIIKSVEDLHKFPFTSFPDYFSTKPRPFIHTDYLLSFFKSVEVFKQHTFDQADYQKTLHSLHIPGM